MKLATYLGIKMTQAKQVKASTSGKITKVGAGYLHVLETDYRCSDCWKFIPETSRCAELGISDVVRPNGYCTMFSYGSPVPGLQPWGSYRPEQVGYGELPDGTRCKNCEYFSVIGDCKIVDKNSIGDDPGMITSNGCCANQEPR